MSLATLADLERARNQRIARMIIADPTHPQHDLIMDLLETAQALTPPEDWVVDRPAPPDPGRVSR